MRLTTSVLATHVKVSYKHFLQCHRVSQAHFTSRFKRECKYQIFSQKINNQKYNFKSLIIWAKKYRN